MEYSRTPLTRTPRGSGKQFELAGFGLTGSVLNLGQIQGKLALVRVGWGVRVNKRVRVSGVLLYIYILLYDYFRERFGT